MRASESRSTTGRQRHKTCVFFRVVRTFDRFPSGTDVRYKTRKRKNAQGHRRRRRRFTRTTFRRTGLGCLQKVIAVAAAVQRAREPAATADNARRTDFSDTLVGACNGTREEFLGFFVLPPVLEKIERVNKSVARAVRSTLKKKN